MKKQKGFSLIEVLVGILLVVVIFVGIINAFTLTLKVVFQSKARITALALASKQMERIRNMPYADIGTVGGIPSGAIEQTISHTLNSTDFTITTTIINIDDEYDDVAPIDPSPNDYKRALVKVTWPGKIGGEIKIITDISPKAMESGAGGTLSIFVQDSNGLGVGQANVRIVNNSVLPLIDATYLTDDDGYVVLPGAPASVETYEITVSKEGYSSDRTYSRVEIANPSKPHLSIFANSLTESGFSIDRTSQLNIQTRNQNSFDDEFDNLLKLSDYSNVAIDLGFLELASSTQYVSSGYIFSESIWPGSLNNWDIFSFSDSEPLNTDVKYHIYYATGSAWSLIPDNDLSGNSVGFDSSPIDLSGLETETYQAIKIGAQLSTSDNNVSPVIDYWHVYYNTSLISSQSFNIVGEKIIGVDGETVYKYSQTKTTNSQGSISLNNMEWDTYSFSSANGLSLVRVNPENPFDLVPNTSSSVQLYFQVTNSLLLTIEEASTSNPIFGAEVFLSNEDLGYQRELTTDYNGRVYFTPLEEDTYIIVAQADEYASTTSYAVVSGNSTKTILLSTEPIYEEPPSGGLDLPHPPSADPF